MTLRWMRHGPLLLSLNTACIKKRAAVVAVVSSVMPFASIFSSRTRREQTNPQKKANDINAPTIPDLSAESENTKRKRGVGVLTFLVSEVQRVRAARLTRGARL